MKKWNVLSQANTDTNILETLLRTKNITDLTAFLNPPSLTDQFKTQSSEFIASLKQAADIIKAQIAKDATIVIHGDYDADGISATAILYSCLKDDLAYNKTSYFIPNRFDHGYGLSTKSIDAVLEKLPQGQPVLFITVDSGITAVDQVKYINELGHKVIITDHHQKSGELPTAECIVWNDNVVGASVAWMLARVLGSKNTHALALAALATITDLQPVLGFNRSIVKEGLKHLNAEPLLGLKKLLQVAGHSGEKITTYDLGWLIGPRLNASGRLVEAEDSLKLLLAQSDSEAELLAQKLNSVNTRRQDITLEMFELASFAEGAMPKLIFSHNTEYHEGIIGLVAAKLVQKYTRPAIVVTVTDTFIKGSVRSVKGFNIIEFLRKFEHMFTSLGGHPMAAGFTAEVGKLEELKTLLVAQAEDIINSELLVPSLDVDMNLPFELATLELAKALEKLEPFGIGNEEPVFASFGVDVAGVDTVGKDARHVRIKLIKPESTVSAIYFNGVDNPEIQNISFASKIDLAYNLKKNVFRGEEQLNIVVKDIRLSNK